MMQGQFPRLKDDMELEEFGERKVVLHLMASLHSCQAAEVGINKISNALMSKTEGFCSHAASDDANDFSTCSNSF